MFRKTIKVQKTIEQEVKNDEKSKSIDLGIKESLNKTNDALDQFIGALVGRLNRQDKSINEINKFLDKVGDAFKEMTPTYKWMYESITKLQKEVKELKQKVEELEGQISINGDNNIVKVVVDS